MNLRVMLLFLVLPACEHTQDMEDSRTSKATTTREDWNIDESQTEILRVKGKLHEATGIHGSNVHPLNPKPSFRAVKDSLSKQNVIQVYSNDHQEWRSIADFDEAKEQSVEKLATVTLAQYSCEKRASLKIDLKKSEPNAKVKVDMVTLGETDDFGDYQRSYTVCVGETYSVKLIKLGCLNKYREEIIIDSNPTEFLREDLMLCVGKKD